ncbi:uncharacterized protein BN685_00744 [Clostridium sp. CAG:508]|jgi:hypothetical protein|nr:WG repeat-containing protein [Clostridia bacterium]CDC31686.1 uncharacterized protein BN685_00744 [Clostridium sp. CAG:508]
MNKKIRWIIIGIVAVIIIAISIMAIINEVQLHYKVEEISEYKYFTLEQNQKYGVIDRNGNIVIEAEYGAVQIPNPSKAIFVCVKEYNENTKEYETVVYNEKKEVLLSNYKNVQAISIYTNVNSTPYEKSVLTYKENGKYGLINLEGKQITKPVYDEISSINYKEGTFLVKQNELEGIINMKGKVIIKCEYESVTSDNYYSENGNKKQAGFIVSKKTEDGYRYGYANYRGTIILNPIYTQLERVTEIANEKGVYFIAFKNGQAGLLKNNKEILNYEYEDIQYNVLGSIFVTKRNGKYGAVNQEGTTVLYPEYDNVYTGGMYLNALKDKDIFIFDLNGNKIETNEVSKTKTENANYYITIDKSNKYKVVDSKDNIIIDKDYTYIEYLPGDYFIVERDSKSGIIDSNGKSVIELKYDSISRINETDILQMETNKNIALYNLNMKEIVSMDNAIVKEVKDEKAYILLYSDTDFKYFDKKGNILTSQNLFENNSLFAKNINGKWGFVDKDGNLKVQNDYELVTDFNKYGFAGIKKDGKWGSINQNGEVVQEPTYDLKRNIPEFVGKYYRVNATKFSDEI